MTTDKKVKNARISIYFDCIIGIATAVTALTIMIVQVFIIGIPNPVHFVMSLGLWIFLLTASVVFIYAGIHIYYLEKKYPHGVPTKKPIKAPMV